jgi:ABC-type transporter Mla subunit MlaD
LGGPKFLARWRHSPYHLDRSYEERNAETILLIVILAAFVLIWLPLRKPATHHIDLTTYFRNGSGVRAAAPVRVDGADVGSVVSLRVRPELGERPVEVRMTIDTPYNLVIPNDSTVSLATEGVLGATLLDIDTRHARGAPLSNNGELKTRELTDAEAAQAMKELNNAIVNVVKKPSPDRPEHGSTEAVRF